MHETIIYTETTFEKISFLKFYYSRVRNKTTSIISTPLLFRIRAYCRTFYLILLIPLYLNYQCVIFFKNLLLEISYYNILFVL